MNSNDQSKDKACAGIVGADFVIRPATPQDFAAIGAFLNPLAIASQAVRHPNLAEKLMGNELHQLAVHQTKIIGRVRLRFKPVPDRSGELGIAVHHAYHRQGIGSALLQAAIEAVEKDLLADRIELQVYADNLAAISLYEKFGFLHLGRIENETGGEATPRLRMVRQCGKLLDPH